MERVLFKRKRNENKNETENALSLAISPFHFRFHLISLQLASLKENKLSCDQLFSFFPQCIWHFAAIEREMGQKRALTRRRLSVRFCELWESATPVPTLQLTTVWTGIRALKGIPARSACSARFILLAAIAQSKGAYAWCCPWPIESWESLALIRQCLYYWRRIRGYTVTKTRNQ